MYHKTLSTFVIFFAVPGLLGAPLQYDEYSLVARDPPVVPAPKTVPRLVQAAHRVIKACSFPRATNSECSTSTGSTSTNGEHQTLQLHDAQGNQHTITTGERLGSGKQGTVHAVAQHDFPVKSKNGLVVKTYHNSHTIGEEEIDSSKKVGQLVFSGRDSSGNPVIVQHRVPGEHLKDTEAWKKAEKKGQPAVDRLQSKADTLAGKKTLHHMEEDGVDHQDLVHGNVKFTQGRFTGKLKEAHLLDWGFAEGVPKGKRPEETRKKLVQEARIDMESPSKSG